MSNSWARPGVKCVCIHGGGKGRWKSNAGKIAPSGPSKNEVCEITDVSWSSELECTVLTLAGYRGRFAADKFRPLVPPKTQADDVALIKSLLTKAPEHA